MPGPVGPFWVGNPSRMDMPYLQLPPEAGPAPQMPPQMPLPMPPPQMIMPMPPQMQQGMPPMPFMGEQGPMRQPMPPPQMTMIAPWMWRR